MAGPKSLKVTKDTVQQVLKGLRGLEAKQCMVGIPSSTAAREPDPDDPHQPNNAELGYILDKGDPAANLPARPFLRPGIKTVQDKIAARYKAGAKAVLDGRVDNVDKVHAAVGQMASDAVKQKIIDGPFAPLSDRTLAARKRKGFAGTKPLIQTGQIKNSVTYVVRPKR